VLASFKVAYRIAKYEKRHSTRESSVLPATADVIETVLGVSYAKELRKVEFADNTVCGEEDYRMLHKTFVINSLIKLKPHVLLCK
jgi:hypothetical protein